MCRVEARRRQVTKGPYFPALVHRADCIAAVFNQPEVVLLRERHHGVHVERIPQGVRQHDRARPIGKCGVQLCNVHVVGRDRDVDEHRYQAVLHDRVDRGGKARGGRDHLVSRFQSPVAQFR